MNLPTPSWLAILYRTLLDLKMSRFKKRSPALGLGCATSVQKKSSPGIPAEDFSRKRIPAIYCAGESAGVSSAPAGTSVVPVCESVVTAGASVAAGLVISAAAGGGVVGVGLVAGVTVSVFCSHAARSAAPARTQMYFFIVETHIALVDQSQQAQFLDRAECWLKHKWLATSTKKVAPISSHALRLPRRK